MRTLYVVGTPIGNLGDISVRAREMLAAASRVFAEDTRRTKALLTHLGISGKAVVRYDAHATPERAVRLVEGIGDGESAALVTDAGMPGVSDPGAELVRAAANQGVRVVPIPGPSAVTAALAASGLVGGPFAFLAFLPRRGKKRRAALERIAHSEEPIVFFEAPSRVAETLRELAELDAARPAALCRELTKLHEEIVRGTLGELAALEREWLGEVTLVVEAGTGRAPEEAADPVELDREIAERLVQGVHPRELSSELARRLGIPRRDAYQRVLAVKNG
ncbi:MAG TPA: 16S rRNA (cytidine(1402)-2'-O)-methyltransferase [Polyangiaceae bacterium]|nr:16S rRNA (cytidine(1402)-2'-O)-methyltransferase [Polyangiaceae bacterium]